MLRSTSPKEGLLACPPYPPWNPSSFTVESTLSSPCSRFGLLFLAKVRLSLTLILSPHDLVLWTGGSVPFSFGKGDSGVLANCFFCGTEATLSFSASPVCSSFLLKPSLFCVLAPLTLWRLSVSLRPLVQAVGSCSASGAPCSSVMPSFLGRGRATTTATTECFFSFALSVLTMGFNTILEGNESINR